VHALFLRRNHCGSLLAKTYSKAIGKVLLISANPTETTSRSVLGSSWDFLIPTADAFFSFSCDATATSLGQLRAREPGMHVGLCEKPVSPDIFWCTGKLSDPWLSVFLRKSTGQVRSFFYCICIDLKTGGISRDSEAAASIIFFLNLSLQFLI